MNPTDEFFLGSQEVNDWAGARRCRITGPAGREWPRGALRVEIDPAGPAGERAVVLAPRFAGDTLQVGRGGRPVKVNIFVSVEETLPPRASDRPAELTGVGEIYGTYREAELTDGGFKGH